MLGIVKADGRKIPLGDESVQCVVTSPPYWGLRKYAGKQELVWGGQEDCGHEWSSNGRRPPHPDRSTGDHDRKGSGIFVDRIERGSQAAKHSRGEAVEFGNTCFQCGAWRGAYGLEATVEMYVQHTVEILREIRRVLRSDGVVFWNIGDSYATGPAGNKKPSTGFQSTTTFQETRLPTCNPTFKRGKYLKPKDLCLIPFRVALAAQADGWWMRSDIIWAKPNPMPESVTDRPTRSHEYIFLLTKSARYYWDAEAVKEPHADSSIERAKNLANPRTRSKGASVEEEGDVKSLQWKPEQVILSAGGRNLRSVWTFATEPYPEAHFATFPEELPKRCILAATSAKGACVKCGTPWEREVENGLTAHDGKTSSAYGDGSTAKRLALLRQAARERGGEYVNESKTLGWRSGCKCGTEEVVPCLVLDPFAGSGTVGKVAIELGRRAILCDLAYQDLASKRTAAIQRPLLAPDSAGWRE